MLNLNQYSGSLNLYKGFLNVVYTDGIHALIEHNVAWLVTDVSVICKMNLKTEVFISITLTIKEDKTAIVTYTDGNKKILFKQEYKYTDFENQTGLKELKMFYTNNTLMLAGEY